MKKLLLISSITLLSHQINAQCLPAINNSSLTTLQNTVCVGQSSTISIGASLPGVQYYLRDNATNTVVTGPLNGTGSPLSFNTGTLSTTQTFHVYGQTLPGGNVALDFDGNDDEIYTNTYSSATNSLTLEAWIYPRATVYKRIISNYKGTTFGGQFSMDTYNATNNGRGLRFFVISATSATHSVTIANVLTLNTWNHVAGTFDNGVMKLYVNGIAVATSTAAFTSLPANSNEITIGEDPSIVVSEFFDGKMDDIRIWNTARTATEISTNMSNCLVGNEVGLKNYWKFFENSGNKVLDIVTNAVGTMASAMLPSTAWTSGNVNWYCNM
ncbi:MAG: LamG domain-containing protein [Sphingobacteriaceae bacterium]|nr:LamG domain-containing protein [Sphingobacteriaceae bacterium]